MSDAAPPGVLVIFALPDESRDFVRLLTRPIRMLPRDHLSPVTGQLDGQRVTILHTGVGASDACRRRVTDFLAKELPRLAISAGYAGGLDPALQVGDLILGENHSDPKLIASARAALAGEPLHVGKLLTQTTVAETAADKQAIHTSTQALAVDMETAWIAAACADRRVPLLALRVISDAAGQSFPVPGRILFDAVRQHPRHFALPLWLLAHPGRIMPFIMFVRGLAPARARLARALRAVLKSR